MKKTFLKITKYNPNAGFTIVELLLYMGIFSILLLILLQIFSSILSVRSESESTSSVDQDANFIISRLTYDIHRASTIAEPVPGVTGQTLQITGAGMDETISVNGNNLMLTDNTGGSSPAQQLNSINTNAQASFTNLGNTAQGSKRSVKITLTIIGKTIKEGGRIESQTFETTVQTR